MVKLTQHSRERIKERIGVPKQSIKKIAEKAYNNGLTHGETDKQLRRYIDKLYLKHQIANNIRIYENGIFLFAGKSLITVLYLPDRFKAR